MVEQKQKTSSTNMEAKQKPVETVYIVLTVKLPKPWLPILQGLSDLVEMSVEEILLSELYGVLEGFFS